MNAWKQIMVVACGLVLPMKQADAADYGPTSKQAFVLSIDGGGVNGLFPALVLERLDACLKEQGLTDQLVRHFDLVAGTSTGSIIVAALVTPKKSAQSEATSPSELVDLYRKHAQTIFPDAERLVLDKVLPPDTSPEVRSLARAMSTPTYSSTGLRNVLSQHLGEHTNHNAMTRYLITGYDVYFGPVSFVTEGLMRDGPTGQRITTPMLATTAMIDQVLASTAAPTFLPPHRVPVQFEAGKRQGGPTLPMYDGGLYAGNPALLAVSEARRTLPPEVKINLLSLGTGIDPKRNEFGYVGDLPKARAYEVALGTLKALMASQIRQVDDFLARDPNISYTRIDPALPDFADMADASEKNIARLESIGQTMLRENAGSIQTYCTALAQPRR